MDPLSIVCVVIGILIIGIRGPMVFAPTATLRVYDRLISTDGRIRGSGLVLAPLAAGLIALPLGEDASVEILRALGGIWAAVTLWLLFAPGSYRRFSRGVLDFFESSMDEAIVRFIGLVAVAIGVALIYFGTYVVSRPLALPSTLVGPSRANRAPPTKALQLTWHSAFQATFR